MSAYSIDYLNKFTRIGFTEKRGNAWHWRQGTTNHFEGPVPIEEAKKLFEPWAYPVKVQTEYVRGDQYTWSGEYIYVSEDTGEKICATTKDHKAHPYSEWLIDNVGNMLDDTVQIGSAGVLKRGAVAWVQVELPQTWEVEGVAFRPNILATTSLDRSLRSFFKATNTIVVCDNTMTMGLAEATPFYSVKHTKHSTFNVQEARNDVGLMLTQQADAFAEEVKSLVSTPVTTRQFDAFLDIVNPIPQEKGRGKSLAETKRTLLESLWYSDPRVSIWKNTVWGVYQMMNTFETHERNVRGENPTEKTMLNMVTGDSFKTDAKVLSNIQKVLVNA